MKLRLHGFFASGTSYRARIALNLKGLSYDYCPVNLRTGEQSLAPFLELNPQGLVPALEHDTGVLIQSPAIIEWLEERFPTPALLPADAESRARVRAMAALIGCDIHPLNNKRVLDCLRGDLGQDEDQVKAWCGRWISAGFQALESLLAQDASRGGFCFGGRPSIADIYLVPQVTSAHRFEVDLGPYPLICDVDRNCRQLDAFQRAEPVSQPDAPAR